MITNHSIPDRTNAPLRRVNTPIVIPCPSPVKRRPTTLLVVLASLILIALGVFSLPGDAGATLCAFGCAGLFGLVYRPTKVKTTGRMYTMRVLGRTCYLYGDEETDRMYGDG